MTARGKDLCGAASLIIGLTSVSLVFVLQLPRFRIFDFRLAISLTALELLLLLGGVILGGIARGTCAGSAWLRAPSACSSGF